MAVNRLPNWRTEFYEYIVRAKAREFSEGEFHCASFCALGVEAITGEVVCDWRNFMRATIPEGLAALQAAGHTDVGTYIRRIFKRVPVAQAYVGDIMVVQTEDGPAFGLCQGAGIYMLTKTGVDVVPLDQARWAYKVGV